MNLLDRHIFKSVLFTCVAAVALFSFVVALGNFVRDLLGPVLAGQISLLLLVRLVALLFPFAVSYALPMGVLTGVLLTLGRLSADSEVTAMRAAGISIVRIARPIFILGFVGMAIALEVNFESMPWARVQYHREFAAALRTNPLSYIVPKTFIRDFKGLVVYVGGRSADGTVLRDIWIWELDNQGRVKRLVRADSGRLDWDEATNSLIPTLYHARTEERDPDHPEDFSKSPKAPSFDKLEEVRLSLNRYLGQDIFHVKPEWLRYGALERRRAELAAEKPAPGHEKELKVERMKYALIVSDKLNLSLAVFAFAFIAVPLGIKVSRRETSANLGVAVFLVLGYYFLETMVKWLDQHPEYRPDLLLWVPNLIFLAFGLWLLRRIQK
ncbi:MAG TPA: LptF/LptG family permease [Opitutaceae bacterium]|nr:LptF/LptG family permease [Opitutaceae bacterium]